MSDSATMTVVDFVRACLDEKEAKTRLVLDDDGERWTVGRLRYDPSHDSVVMLDQSEVPVIEADEPLAAHIADNDPAAVLADIAAKRRILDEYTESASRTVAHGAPSNAELRTAALADVIQILAEAYADRPGYNESWRPA